MSRIIGTLLLQLSGILTWMALPLVIALRNEMLVGEPSNGAEISFSVSIVIPDIS